MLPMLSYKTKTSNIAIINFFKLFLVWSSTIFDIFKKIKDRKKNNLYFALHMYNLYFTLYKYKLFFFSLSFPLCVC